MKNNVITRAKRWGGEIDARSWNLAWLASKLVTREDVIKFKNAIRREDDTVRNLSDAYGLFRLLVIRQWKKNQGSESVRALRRQFPYYTRWAVVFRSMRVHEFGIEEAVDWLVNFDGGNDAMEAEIENKHGSPEWMRQAHGMYSLALKVRDGFGAPPRLQTAAVYFAREFDAWRNEEENATH